MLVSSKPAEYECPVCQGRGRVPSRLPGRTRLCPDAMERCSADALFPGCLRGNTRPTDRAMEQSGPLSQDLQTCSTGGRRTNSRLIVTLAALASSNPPTLCRTAASQKRTRLSQMPQNGLRASMWQMIVSTAPRPLAECARRKREVLLRPKIGSAGPTRPIRYNSPAGLAYLNCS